MVDRKAATNKVVLSSPQGIIEIVKLLGRGFLIRLSGKDDGAFGMIPFDELDHLASRIYRPDLFIDTSSATAVSTIVTNQWTNWLSNNKRLLGRIHILSSGKFFLIAASIMRELSQA